MSLFKIIILALIQGAAELLPVSSSAHVIVVEKMMGLDPSSPEMTFLLVMLHSGTMFAVLFYFWPRWKKLNLDFLKSVLIATSITGVVGLGLKKFIEKVVLEHLLGHPQGEIESLFKSLPLIAAALFSVGLLILFADWKSRNSVEPALKTGNVAGIEGRGFPRLDENTLNVKSTGWIGIVQGLCLPFRGFSRSGATISTALLLGVSRERAEDFSFALAVVLTPPVVALELHRLLKASNITPQLNAEIWQLLGPGFLGMVFSFGAGLLALRWLSAWLEGGRWKYFGIYCIIASMGVFLFQFVGG